MRTRLHIFTASVVAVIWLVAGVSYAQAQASATTTTVYVTKTGAKYHAAGCRHLAKGSRAIALKDAVGAYGPCSTCKPPTAVTAANTVAATAASVVPAAPAPRATSSGRCQATTKKGSQCSRNAQAGRSYCYQH